VGPPLIFSMPVITHSRMSMSVRDMSLRGWGFQAAICTDADEDNDRVLTISLAQLTQVLCVDVFLPLLEVTSS
jgi:hypothetical protein